MQALYQLDVLGDYFLAELRMWLRDSEDDDDIVLQAEEWTRGAWANVAACDNLIRSAGDCRGPEDQVLLVGFVAEQLRGPAISGLWLVLHYGDILLRRPVDQVS